MSEITFEHVSYAYADQWQEEKQYAIKDVSFTIKQGEFVAIIGKAGSGKSTLLQHLNALLQPTEGKCYFNGQDMGAKDLSLKPIRQKVALCFQYPEYQLFEESVIKDICFGPENMGFSKEESLEKARAAMRLMNLPEKMEEISPFSLSGGQKRRVALAGILAMEPDFLVLDEPIAGMDQRGKENLFRILHQLNEEKNIGIILVSHDMDDVAAHARRVIVMSQGEKILDDDTRKVFAQRSTFKKVGLEVPSAVDFYYRLKREGFGDPSETEFDFEAEVPLTVEELAEYISNQIEYSGEQL